MNVKQRLNEHILEMVQNIEKPEWERPWIARSKCNFLTGHPYSGSNAAYVAFIDDDFFITYKQAAEIGFIKHGSRSIPIAFYTLVKDKTDETKTRPVLTKYYTVFGLSQVEITNLEKFDHLQSKRTKKFVHKDIPDIEELMDGMGVKIAYDPARAFYRTDGDTVYIPKKDQFENIGDYYRTCFHEIGHWTGKNLDRQFGKFGSPVYAREELVAEIFSIYISEDYGLDGNEASAHYLKGWLTALKDNPDEIVRAFTAAEKAYKYIVSILQ